jgi:hypothetical protein
MFLFGHIRLAADVPPERLRASAPVAVLEIT